MVLKKISLEGDFMERQTLMDSFVNELTIMLDLYSPRVLRVYGVCTKDATFSGLVIEYCPFGDLRSYLDDPDKHLDTEQKMTILKDIAQVK